jgi:hypothetical protein
VTLLKQSKEIYRFTGVFAAFRNRMTDPCCTAGNTRRDAVLCAQGRSMETNMSKMIALAVVALSLTTVAASAQTGGKNQDTGYQACTTDEGYGRRTPCDVGGGG